MPTQSTNRNTTWNIDTGNDDWTLTKNATITTDGEEGILVEKDATGNDIHIDGDVVTTGTLYNVRVLGGDNTIFVGANASIGGAFAHAANVGIGIDADGMSISNAGEISGGFTGIAAHEGGKIVNTGTVEGVNAIYASDSDFELDNRGKLLGEKLGMAFNDDGAGATILNRNDGVIKGGEVGVDFANATATLKNYGTISSQFAITGGDGETVVLNRGSIHGYVALGSGKDRFDTRGGTVSDSVDGGAGNDTYLVSSQSIAITEQTDNGNDLVKSTVSLALAKNLESLTLLGHKNTDGRGNGGANSMTGNSGDNMIKGLAGSDDLSGGKGDDVLIGGNGADLFVFNHGDGRDTIADFHDGKDVILTDFVSSEEDFYMMLNHHLTVKGDDLLLHGKHESLLIRNMDINNLDYSDFFTGL